MREVKPNILNIMRLTTKITIGLIMLIFTCIFISCTSKNDRLLEELREEMRKEREAEEIAKDARLKQYTDSTVCLSFKGIELGKPFLKAVHNARNKNEIYNLNINKDKSIATCKAKLYSQNSDNLLVVDIEIKSYQDTVSEFIIKSRNSNIAHGLETLYKSKYDVEYSQYFRHEGDWADREVRKNKTTVYWTFKNQKLEVVNYTIERREVYVKDARMSAPQNRYGTRYYSDFDEINIRYVDFYHNKKHREYEDKLKREIDSISEIERIKAKRADSIKRAEIKARAISQDI